MVKDDQICTFRITTKDAARTACRILEIPAKASCIELVCATIASFCEQAPAHVQYEDLSAWDMHAPGMKLSSFWQEYIGYENPYTTHIFELGLRKNQSFTFAIGDPGIAFNLQLTKTGRPKDESLLPRVMGGSGFLENFGVEEDAEVDIGPITELDSEGNPFNVEKVNQTLHAWTQQLCEEYARDEDVVDDEDEDEDEGLPELLWTKDRRIFVRLAPPPPKLKSSFYSWQIARFHVTLRWMDEEMWRDIEVPGTTQVSELAQLVIRLMDGDPHYHAWCVTSPVGHFEPRNPYGEYERGIKYFADDYNVSQLGLTPGIAALVEYDFGDGWAFAVRLDALRDASSEDPGHAVVLAGEGAGIVDDIGGIYSLHELVEAQKNGTYVPYDEEEDTGSGDYAHWVVPPEWDYRKFDLKAAQKIADRY